MASAKQKTGTRTSSAKKAAASSKANGAKTSSKKSASSTAGRSSSANRARAASNGGSSAKGSRGKSPSGSRPNKGIVSAVMGKVTEMLAPAEPNAIDLLEADHRVVDALFEKVRANEDGNNRPTFRKIKVELDVHTQIEETVFYPYLLKRGDKELKKIVREGIEEHRQAKMFLAELDGLTGTSEQFKAKLQVLMEDVDHHVKEEENDMFPMVEDQIGEKTLQRLGAELRAEKARLKKKMAGKTAKPTAKRQAAATRS